MADYVTINQSSQPVGNVPQHLGNLAFAQTTGLMQSVVQGGVESIRFVMAAKHATLTYVTWEVDAAPDYVGTSSPYNPGDLSNIRVLSHT